MREGGYVLGGEHIVALNLNTTGDGLYAVQPLAVMMKQ